MSARSSEARSRALPCRPIFADKFSLPDRTLRVTADISAADAPAAQTPALVFDVTGDWDNVAVTPQVRSLIERSGAAKPLFPTERVPADRQRPQAIAQ